RSSSSRAPPRPTKSDKQKTPLKVGGVLLSRRFEKAQSFLRKPENFFWNRDTRPPRSRICWEPPVQAGCDLGSMSRLSLSPSLPQVERVWYSAPSDITTVII